MAGIEIVLTEAQLARAYAIGDRLAHRAARNGWTRGVASNLPSAYRHRAGAAAEYVVGMVLGLQWNLNPDAFHTEPDLWPDVEVRSTRYEYGRLIIRRDDDLQRRYVLVIEDAPRFVLAGWLYGYEAAALAPLVPSDRTRVDARFIPQDKLHVITTFGADGLRVIV